jgi:hypothetical protein
MNCFFKAPPVWQELGRDPDESGPEVLYYNGLEKILHVIAGDFDLGLECRHIVAGLTNLLLHQNAHALAFSDNPASR